MRWQVLAPITMMVFAVGCESGDAGEVSGTATPSGTSSAEPGEKLALFILAGQSNMSGRDSVSAEYRYSRYEGTIWNYSNAGEWRSAEEPIDDSSGQVYPISRDDDAGVGPGLAFADYLHELFPSGGIGLIPCPKGGSRIEDWLRDYSTESLYGSCLARINQAKLSGEIAGILFYQGESDTFTFEQADEWPSRFAQFVSEIRADLADPQLPVVFAQIATIGPPWSAYSPAWDHLKLRQASVNIPNVAMVTTDDLQLIDPAHLDAASQYELGKRFAQTYFDLFNARMVALSTR